MKITPEVVSLINSIANDLPQITKREVTRRVKGSTLIDQGIKEVKGEEIKPEVYYAYVTHSIQAHVKALTQIFKKKGAKGIDEYVALQKELAIDLIKKQSERRKRNPMA